MTKRLLPLCLLVACGDPSVTTPDAAPDASIDAAAATWKLELQDPAYSFKAVWGSGPNDVYAVGAKGSASAILHSTGDGHWVEQTTGVNGGLLSIWGSGPNDIYVGGPGDILLHSTGDGVWTPQTIPNLGVVTIWGSGPDDVYIAYPSSGGNVYHSTGNGTWSQLAIGDSSSIFMAMWGSSATDVYFGGGRNYLPTVMHGPASPTTQTISGASSGHDILKMWGSGPSDIYAVGNSLAILHSDGGGTWTEQTSPPGTSAFLGVWGTGSTSVYVVGDTGVYHASAVYHSTGDGTWTGDEGWAADPYLRVLQPQAIWGASDDDIYVVGAYIARRTK